MAPKLSDRPAAQPVPAPPPKVKRKGGYYVIPVKGGYGLPKHVSAALGCKGEVILTIKKGKKLLTARTTALSKTCGYSKKVSVAKAQGRLDEVAEVHDPLRRQPVPGPVKRTYNVKVPH